MPVLVSVCIPTCNGSKFLQEALDSVSHQTYNHLEVIISDDASSDNTLKIVQAFKAVVSFPVYVFHHQPFAIGANWNNCIRKANGEFIKFLFQDDVLKPLCIERMVEAASGDRKIDLVYCRRSFLFDAQNENHRIWIANYGNLHKHWKNIFVKEGFMSGKNYLKDPNLFGFPDNKIGEPTAVLIRKSVFDSIGYFRSDLFQLLDIEFWYRIMKGGKVAFIDAELISFRLHEDQATRKNYNRGINDYHRLSHIFYHEYWKYLHPVLKWKITWQVTRLRKIVNFFKYK